jgi:hypothetical protein
MGCYYKVSSITSNNHLTRITMVEKQIRPMERKVCGDNS